MKFRHARKEDIPKLYELYQAQGFDYKFPDLESPLMEACLVLVDDNDQPVAAILAERIVQLYLLCGKPEHPAQGIGLIRNMHRVLQPLLAAKGYGSAEAFLPPSVERSFGRRLMRSFGWVKNWASYSFPFQGVR